MAGNKEKTGAPAAATTAAASSPPQEDGYLVDIRLFLALIAFAMAGSFLVGMGLTPVPAMAPATLQTSDPRAVRDYAGESVVVDHVAAAESDDLHLPAGQHLLVDIKGVDSDFLNSEERLSSAMVDTVKAAGLTMLSYHCHSLLPAGVSCVGVLLESHISFHTWPAEGVITLDLFTCGPNPLLPVVPIIERLFGVGENTRSQWSHELRGFRPESEKRKNYLDNLSDLSLWVLSPHDMHTKKQIVGTSTKFQRVDIWDIVEITDTPSYADILKYNITPGDPRLRSPDFTTPDRILFLDGIIQSTRFTEPVYHEAMVHPAMFAHPNPKNVAILGGGEGATLREVLKHKNIESVTMIELDEELVQICREYLPEYSDCSDLVGRADNCFDDERANIEYSDGRKWFVDRYGENSTTKPSVDRFDVILIDALDPEEEEKLSDSLYSDNAFISSMINSLSDDGILAVQVGVAATIDDPRPDKSVYKSREALFNAFESHPDVTTMFVYEEAHCGYLEPHSFLVVCKTEDCRGRWYARSDQVDFEIYERIVTTKSKKRALTFYDGTTQRSYQWPKKGWETVYCRREPAPFECAYREIPGDVEFFDVDLDQEDFGDDFRIEFYEEDGEKKASVFAKRDIKKGSFIMAEHLASSVLLTQRNMDGLENNLHVGGGRVAIIADLLEFFEDYAHNSTAPGSHQVYVEVGASALIRRVANLDESNIEKWMPPHPSGKRPKYSPVYERHRNSYDVFMVASRDIKAGEEVLMHQALW